MSQTQTPVTVYRTRLCPFCVAAAEFLQQRGVTVSEVFLDDHPDRRGFTSSLLPGHETVPLVVIGDRAVGGFDDLRQLDATGELAQLLLEA